MDADEYLKQVTIPSPCQADWDAMRGDGRSRFCESCGKSVFNLASMSRDEAASLIASEDELCVQLTRRKDGSIVSAGLRPGLTSIRSLMVAIAWIAAALGFFKLIGSTAVTRGAVYRPQPAAATAPEVGQSCDPADESE